ncbi:hypothetical protein [uncultured Dialister sp.]|jgi:hypothetical protein|uniref:hypothetical protein n=1 Tax=uncultured Dialister sp. TaxID=278064 RepID=UPI0025D0ECB1|nr:hypothetical protein [uncultured Dialister sp.]
MISKTAGIETCCFFMHKIQGNVFNREEEKTGRYYIFTGFRRRNGKSGNKISKIIMNIY